MNQSTPSSFSIYCVGENSQAQKIPVGDGQQDTIAVLNAGPDPVWFSTGQDFSVSTAAETGTSVAAGSTVTASLSGATTIALISGGLSLVGVSVGS